ncbi:hypothetical protein DFH07DRAFT_953942 [Mycena maculata]|uniref:Uncharacterized protein n=1 Tax=Mycena maculata TaxID=230809 RepID=A0AAD7JSK7_9AGAR|nr:hypothetical protein DFH07DRAFT_953942 [Mycena maculata]
MQVQFLSDWLPYCIGGELVDKMLGDAIIRSRQLFLDVLWTRGPDANFRAYGQIPTDFCWIDDIDRRDTWDGDSDAGQRDSDWEECPWEEEEDNSMDEDFDPDYIVDDLPDLRSSPTDLPELVNFVQSPAKPVVSVLPRKPRQTPASDGDELPFQWATHIRQFFFPEKDEMSGDEGEEAEERSAWDVVDDLVHMRLLKAPHYTRKSFQIALEESGLLDLMHRICRPGNLLETSHPDVEQSFRWHNWKVSYAEVYCRWVAPTLTQEQYDKTLPVPDPDYVFSLKEAMELFQFMSAHPRMLPWSFNPMAVFFLLSAECFAVNCETWLVPCLRELEYPRLDGWNSRRVYQRITSTGVFLTPHLHASFLNGLDPRLALIIQETVNHRTSLRKISREVFRTPNPKPSSEFGDGYESSEASDFDVSDSPKTKQKKKKKKKNSDNGEIKGVGGHAKDKVLGRENTPPSSKTHHNSCTYCAGRPMEEQCIRIIYVKPRDCRKLLGAALTCAPTTDRLKPKPLPKRKKGTKAVRKRRPRIRYFHPFDDLKMEFITYRRDVYRRCRKDIVRFVCQHDGIDERVGGVRFKAFSRKTLIQLRDNHRRVVVRAIRRREAMEAWAYGTMTGSGSRQAAGGYKGDGYGPYACHHWDTPDDIKALFRHAVDNDIMVGAGASIYPPMQRELGSTTSESGINRFGRFGVSTFTCTNYISSTHFDPDIGIHDLLQNQKKSGYVGGLYPCTQLTKTGCGPHDYNFAYARWGVVIQTRPNTVWVFNGRHEHGTVMPSQSAVNAEMWSGLIISVGFNAVII